MAGLRNNPLNARRPLSAVERAEQAMEAAAATPATVGEGVATPQQQKPLVPEALAPVTPPPAAVLSSEPAPLTAPPTPKKSTKVVPAQKTQVTAYVNRDVDNASRNAEYGLRSTPGAPDNYSEYVTEALRFYTSHVERTYNDGQPFAQRPSKSR